MGERRRRAGGCRGERCAGVQLAGQVAAGPVETTMSEERARAMSASAPVLTRATTTGDGSKTPRARCNVQNVGRVEETGLGSDRSRHAEDEKVADVERGARDVAFAVGLPFSGSVGQAYLPHALAAPCRDVCRERLGTAAGNLERASPRGRRYQRPLRPILSRATALSAAVGVVYVRRAVLTVSALAHALDRTPASSLLRVG